MKWVRTVIGAVIAISVIPVLMSSIGDLTGEGGALTGTAAGTLLDIAPLVLVAGVLAYIFTKSGSKADL